TTSMHTSRAQDDFPQASAEDLGLRLPANVPSLPGNDRHVIVPAEIAGEELRATIAGDHIVGKVHIEVGDLFVVLLPTGKLVVVPKSETQITDRAFEPFTKEQFVQLYNTSAFRNFRTNATRRYVSIYNCSNEFAEGTSRIVETLYRDLVRWCKNLELEPQAPLFPMVILIFSTEEGFQKYRRMPPGVVAYYNLVTNHVVMYEQRELAEAAPQIAFKQSVSTIAHEGAHQVLHNIGVQDRLAKWPLWIGEGLAEYCAPTQVDDRIHWKGVGYTNDLRLYDLAQFYQQLDDPNLTRGQLLRQTVEANSLNSLGYAMSWSTVDFLAKRRKQAFTDYLKEVSQLQPLAPTSPGTMFTKHFGSDFVKLETEIGKHVSQLPYKDPIEHQPHYVVFARHGSQKKVKVSPSATAIRRFLNNRNDLNIRAIKIYETRTAAKQAEARWLGE
ncbi:MAG: DUF1570 domain-containing protein, partial [Planctomycetales bacterium]|nr:DUF1570 domain-containing protein [Planctomycetales bacterium]